MCENVKSFFKDNCIFRLLNFKYLIIQLRGDYMVGERLADLRKDKGLKQVELAETLKISLHTLSNYEREKSTPDDDMKCKIAKFFNVSLDYLLGLINDERPIGGGKSVVIPEKLPLEAVEEITEFVEYIKMKYQNRIDK